MTSTPLITLSQVSVLRDGKSVVDSIDLRIFPQEILSLIGPNGAGKSTLVRLILGLVKPSSGRIEKAENLRIGYMPQHVHIEQTMPLTVRRFLGISRTPKAVSTKEVLKQVGAAHLTDSPVQSLSGGELQRVLLARSLLRRPQLLVLDEPAQGVDINGQAELYALIKQIRDQYQCAILMVSHDLHLVMSATDKVICMNHHICCSGLPEQISQDPGYRELFGVGESENLALYAHNHDHSHDDHGKVVEAGHEHG